MCFFRLPGFALALALIAGPAFAALAPQYYQRARDAAADVVVIAVATVDPPPGDLGHGDCTVRGAVTRVERGARYHMGDQITIAVPCVRDARGIPSGGVVWQDWSALQSAHAGRAYLNRGELALYQYEILREP